jgi:hypothetical protein
MFNHCSRIYQCLPTNHRSGDNHRSRCQKDAYFQRGGWMNDCRWMHRISERNPFGF